MTEGKKYGWVDGKFRLPQGDELYTYLSEPRTPEDMEAWKKYSENYRSGQKRLWESLPGRTLQERRWEGRALVLTFSDGLTMKVMGEHDDDNLYCELKEE